ncbi:hypothetical protein PIB30_077045 [Stylosanthes scabra]|uniref:Uncharacterized protein n=1 Tax=Stylosanthes scabra TaxID=79078 RepID=A0ABU6TR37_9FABA|nr:hypothetical protein [Stylosanthes scabra]
MALFYEREQCVRERLKLSFNENPLLDSKEQTRAQAPPPSEVSEPSYAHSSQLCVPSRCRHSSAVIASSFEVLSRRLQFPSRVSCSNWVSYFRIFLSAADVVSDGNRFFSFFLSSFFPLHRLQRLICFQLHKGIGGYKNCGEAFRSLFGKEQPSRHQEEVTTLKCELGDVKIQQQQQAKEIHGLRSIVKLLLLRSEPDMRPEEVKAMLQNVQNSPVDTTSGHGSTHHIRNVSMARITKKHRLRFPSIASEAMPILFPKSAP